MIENNRSLLALLKQLQRVPYLASKNLYIVAEYFLNLDEQEIGTFCQTLKDAKQNTEKCDSCWAWKEKEGSCTICTSPKRDKHTICVVETWRDMIVIEKTAGYNGLYHILGGAICPLDGIGPDNLTIKQLLQRIEGGCQELILALSQTPEGEATAIYIATKLKNKDIKISCIARGLPVGSSLESMDRLTVSKALSERRPY